MNIKRPQYLSPTALDAFLGNIEEFFLKYLAIDRPPRIPQTQPMAVGAGFDAYIKSFLHRRLFGDNHKHSPDFAFDQLFEKQVEPQNRDFAKQAGANCFVAYKKSGALQSLLALLTVAPEEPRFEFTEIAHAADNGVYNKVKATSNVERILSLRGLIHDNPVVILGKPDLFFRLRNCIAIILDWKVNGYLSNSGKSPTPGYWRMLDGFEPQSKNHGGSHRECIPYNESGFEYSLHPNLEHNEEGWARQISAYSWICGAEVGSEIIACIDQLACKPSYPSPMITVAQHRCPITEAFQVKTYTQFQEAWDVCHGDHIFRHLSKEDSEKRVNVLLRQAAVYVGDDPKTKWLRDVRSRG